MLATISPGIVSSSRRLDMRRKYGIAKKIAGSRRKALEEFMMNRPPKPRRIAAYVLGNGDEQDQGNGAQGDERRVHEEPREVVTGRTERVGVVLGGGGEGDQRAAPDVTFRLQADQDRVEPGDVHEECDQSGRGGHSPERCPRPRL